MLRGFHSVHLTCFLFFSVVTSVATTRPCHSFHTTGPNAKATHPISVGKISLMFKNFDCFGLQSGQIGVKI